MLTSDFDDIIKPGIYITSDYYGIPHAPANKNESCYMLVFGESWIIQIVFSTYAFDGIYVRRNYGETWSEWKLASYS